MKVTLIGSLPPHKGISPYTLALACALAERDDIELEVLTFRGLYPRWLYPGGDPSDGTQTMAGVPGAHVRRSLWWWNPLSWVLAGLTLRGEVVHAQWWSFFLAPAYVTVLALARLRGKRVVITVHNVEPHEGGWARRLANRAALPLGHALIVHSERNRASAQRAARGRPVAVIPHGVLVFGVPTPERAEARTRLGFDHEADVVLFFGNIRPYKGLATLIEAFGAVARRRPLARLVVAGQPWEPWERYDRMVRARGLSNAVIAMPGFVPEETAADLFAAADVIVLPYTHFDGQSGVATLALSSGRPLVVTDVGGLPELAGDAAAVVPPGASGQLGNALERVLGDAELRRTLESNARRKARELSWDTVANQTSDLYQSIAHGVPATEIQERSGEIIRRETS